MPEATKDRRYLDSLHQEAGWAFRRCAPMQKHLAMALDVDASWISGQCTANRPGVVQRFFEYASDLVQARKCHAGPLAGEVLVVMQDAMRPFEADEVEELFREAMRQEFEAQAREDEATADVYYWLERTRREDAVPRDLEELSTALGNLQEAVADEVGWEITKRVIAKELQRRVRGEIQR